MSDIVFETERLVARSWNPERDAFAAHAMYGDPEVTRFIGGVTRPDVDATREYLRAVVARDEAFGAPYGAFPLFLRETGELVGAGLMKPLPDATGAPSADIEIGWHLVRRAWGHGYATEAGRALLVRCFAQTSEARILAVVASENSRSRAVAHRIGMRHVGRTDRYYGKMLELFAITREEHEARIGAASRAFY